MSRATTVLLLGIAGCHIVLPYSPSRDGHVEGILDGPRDAAGAEVGGERLAADRTVETEPTPTCAGTPQGSCASNRPQRCVQGQLQFDCTCCSALTTLKGKCDIGGKSCLVELAPTQDTFTAVYARGYQNTCTPDCTMTSFGGENYLYVAWWGATDTARAYIDFGLARLPPDATVQSAELKLYLADWGYGVFSSEIRIVTGAWSGATTDQTSPTVDESMLTTVTLSALHAYNTTDLGAPTKYCRGLKGGCTGFRISATVSGNSAYLDSGEGANPPLLVVGFK